MLSEKGTVHVIDDDDAVRESLTFLLRTAQIEVGSYPSAAAFLDALPNIRSSCVITDVRMPDVSGIDLIRRLKALKIAVPVIVITGHSDVPLAVEAMKLGAVDFLEKPFNDDLLLTSVRSALKQQDGETRRQTERAEIESRLAALSNRERDVLDGLVAGRANKQIAFDLGISPRTVEIYRAHLMTKMQASSLSELVRMALIAEILGAAPEAVQTPPYGFRVPQQNAIVHADPWSSGGIRFKSLRRPR
jgi:two-component system response regulator FixJ